MQAIAAAEKEIGKLADQAAGDYVIARNKAMGLRSEAMPDITARKELVESFIDDALSPNGTDGNSKNQ